MKKTRSLGYTGVFILALLLISGGVWGDDPDLPEPSDMSGDLPGAYTNSTIIPKPEPFFDPSPAPGEEGIPPVIGGESGWFQFTSEPQGAEVIFDGIVIGSTPTEIEVPSTGTPYHTVTIRLSGYRTWDREYHDNPGPDESIRVFARLIPETCCTNMRITSAPSGAQILLNGLFQGYTPKTIENLRPGFYSVTLNRDGYESWHNSIEVTLDDDNSIYVVLEPLFAPITSGTLTLTTSPPGAEIILDQTVRGTTPRTLTLPEGSHSITLNLAGYRQYETSVYIRDTESSRFEIALVPDGEEKDPVIITSSDTPLPLLSDLESLSDEAMGYLQRTGIEPFLQEINRPDGKFCKDGAYISVMAENGTLLAHPYASSWIHRYMTDAYDQNQIPFGISRMALAEFGGGATYESDIANTSEEGGLLISSVRPVTSTLVITVSSPLHIPLPGITPDQVSLLMSGDGQEQKNQDEPFGEVTISVPQGPEDPRYHDSQDTILNQTDTNEIIPLQVLRALAIQGGGYCYITDPGTGKITLAYASPADEGRALVRWVTDPRVDSENTNGGVIHS